MSRRPLTLATTLSLYIGGGLFALAVIFGIALQQGVSRILDDALTEQSRALAKQLAIVTLDAVLVHDYGTLERFLRDLAHETGVRYLRIRRSDGETLGEVGVPPPEPGGPSTVTVVQPVVLADNPIGDVTVAYSRQPVDRLILRLSLVGLAGTALITLCLFFLQRRIIERRLIRPMQALARQVSPLRGAPAASVNGLPEELVRIGRTFGELCQEIMRHGQDREDMQRLALTATHRLCHDQRMVMVGQMVAGLAHALNTPLGNILGYAQRAQQSTREPTVLEQLAIIERQARSCTATVEHLLSGVRSPEPRVVPMDLVETVRQSVRLMTPVVVDRGTRTVTVEGCEACPVRADPGLVEQVLFNLLTNAADAGAHTIQVRLACFPDRAELAVEDDGAGVPETVRGRLFLPFVTSKDPGQGTGLGLYLCKTLLGSMGGDIDLLESRPGKTVLRVTLPRRLEAGVPPETRLDELPRPDR